MARARKPRLDKYELYERSVQSPKRHVEFFLSVYRELRDGRFPRRLREDFCGTFRVSTEWVARNRKNSAIALDLDPEPLAYGKKTHLKALSSEQKKRLDVRRADVREVTLPRSDLAVAGNFSFFVFQDRRTLVAYFRSVRRSLGEGGVFILEMAGGPGMISRMRERKLLSLGPGKGKFTYVWDQKSFDPMTHRAHYAIHFQLPDGRKLQNAFTYDWRLWTIPEVRDALVEAGFGDTAVYWETEHKGKPTGEYARSEEGDNAYAWIAYVAGLKASS